ncbi:MAG: hypothetical protein ACTHJW_06735, partial [Streptosporangiaceae bacterium]
RGRPPDPAFSLRGNTATMRAVAFGREPITEAERAGGLTVMGDRGLAEVFTHMFPIRRAEANATR